MDYQNNAKSNFGRFLRQLREKRGLSLRQVEQKAGISHSYLSQVEKHEKIPSAQVLSRLAPILHVDALVLFEEAGLMAKKTKDQVVSDDARKYLSLPPGLRELSEDSFLMEHFKITSFELTRLSEFNFKRGAKLDKKEFLLLILFLRQINA
jgi:transcriptional regulator with XRE-family HTH domain